MSGDAPVNAGRCAYPGCENEADPQYRCLVCQEHFCAFHIYQRGGYVCKTHFNEPSFEPTEDEWLSPIQWLEKKLLRRNRRRRRKR